MTKSTAAQTLDIGNLIAIATKSKTTSAEIQTALAGARALIMAATAEHDQAEADYRAGLLTMNESQLQSVADAKAKAIIRRDRATALVETLEARLAETTEAEAATGRKTAYEDAQAQAQRAAALLRERYPALCEQMCALLREVYTAEAAVIAANQKLPADAQPLQGPEFMARGTPGRDRRVVSEATVELWARPDGTQPAANQHAIVGLEDGTGQIPKGPMALQGSGRFVKRQFIRREIVPARRTHMPAALANHLALPAFDGGMAFSSVAPPFHVAGALAQLAKSGHTETKVEKTPTEVEFEIVGGTPKAVPPASPPTPSRRSIASPRRVIGGVR